MVGHGASSECTLTIMQTAPIVELITVLAAQLRQRQWLLSTCESCTGGLIAKQLTDLAGSSEWFAGGLVTYTNASKTRLASVAADLIETHGAVSEPVAEAMAIGCHQALDSDVALSVTGIAGPGGAVAGKPVGTVCFGWALPDGVWTTTQHFDGDRRQVRERSMVFALQQLLHKL